MQVGQIVRALAREVQARRLSDITTPICPTCGGSGEEVVTQDGMGEQVHAHIVCTGCDGTGHIPLKVWVGMLTDALRLIPDATIGSWDFVRDQIDIVLRLADSVTPKENE